MDRIVVGHASIEQKTSSTLVRAGTWCELLGRGNLLPWSRTSLSVLSRAWERSGYWCWYPRYPKRGIVRRLHHLRIASPSFFLVEVLSCFAVRSSDCRTLCSFYRGVRAPLGVKALLQGPRMPN